MFAQIRTQFVAFWTRLGQMQRALFIGVLIVAAILVPVLVNWASTPSYAVAFSGLTESDAGEIVQKLAADGIPYQVQAGGTILVPSDQVYETRLSVATAGLLNGGTVGFEIFSGNTFGMTEFTQRVNYQRALEGELERTISSLSAVDAVRVHIVSPEKTLLTEAQAPTTASVTIKTRAGMKLSAEQVTAITHLLASSVEGLTPENVVVVDTAGNMLSSGTSSGNDPLSAQTDSRRAAEAAFAADLESRVRSLLDAALGANRSVVQASVTLDWTQKEVLSETFDPDKSVVRSNEKIVENSSSTGAGTSGTAGAGSNLPAGATAVPGTGGSSTYSRSEEITNFEVSSSQSKETILPGEVSRISLSVLVDGVTDAQQLEALRTAIAAAAGIDSARGDLLAVQTLTFDRTAQQAEEEALTSSQNTDLYLRIAEIAGAAILLAALLWYIQRLLGNLRVSTADAWTPVLRPASELALAGGMPSMRPQLEPASAAMPALGETSPAAAMAAPSARPAFPSGMARNAGNTEDEQLQKVVSRLAEENPASVAEIIQMWLSKEEK